ncbi:nucloid associated Lsr2-like [Mycobacterium phage Krypton555]|nr:nucloid associated Lsr2-like [Mycobacterium phage Krypton555]ASR87073.1 Lsr2-like DNA bridging protein [Mycobacterium phage Krypton555]
MGKRVTVTLFDDLDDTLDAETEREFSVGNVGYHLDLSEKNAKLFDADMAKWTEVASRTGTGTGRARKRSGTRITHSGGEPGLPLAEIRAWAQANGMDVAEKGRVSAEVVRAWKAATSEDKPEPAKKAAPAKKAPTAKKDEPAFSGT